MINTIYYVNNILRRQLFKKRTDYFCLLLIIIYYITIKVESKKIVFCFSFQLAKNSFFKKF